MEDLFGQSRERVISVKVSSTPRLQRNQTPRQRNASQHNRMIRPDSPDMSMLAVPAPDLQESIVDNQPRCPVGGEGDMTLSLIYYCICAGAGRLK